VTDVRKVIEAEYLRQRGFSIVRLDISSVMQARRLVERDAYYNPGELQHWTETDLDHYPYFKLKVLNNGAHTPGQLALFILRSLGMEVGYDGE
jgi:hypothetical protein